MSRKGEDEMNCELKGRVEPKISWRNRVLNKALHSELLTELSSQFSSWNEFFAISEV